MLQRRVFFWLTLSIASWPGEFGQASIQLSWCLIGEGAIWGACKCPVTALSRCLWLSVTDDRPFLLPTRTLALNAIWKGALEITRETGRLRIEVKLFLCDAACLRAVAGPLRQSSSAPPLATPYPELFWIVSVPALGRLT